MAHLPAYAMIDAGRYTVTDSADVRRTQLDDGAVRQAQVFTSRRTLRSVVILLGSDADRVRLYDWLAEHFNGFEFTDPEDGVTRSARVRGGLGEVRWTAIVGDGAVRRWECEMVIEGGRTPHA